MSTDQQQSPKNWADEAEEALNRVAEALRVAWADTREARTSTLESAREAVTRLGEAIDQGLEAAKQSWNPSQDQPRAAPGPEAAESATSEEE